MERIETTYERAERIINSYSKKELFDEIYLNSFRELSAAHIIVEFIYETSTTFCKDIANKAMESRNLSEKQVWCLVFEIEKIKNNYNNWYVAQVAELEEIEF